MTNKLAAFTLLAAVFAAACSGGGGEPTPSADGANDAVAPAATKVAVVDPTAELAAAPDATGGSDERLGAGGSALLEGLAGDNVAGLDPDAPLGTGGAALLGGLSPLDLFAMGAGANLTSGASPELIAYLLQASDLPSDFIDLGDFRYSTPSEYGDVDMAASIFATGDEESGEMVMSMALTLPPGALAELGDLRDLAGFDEADLAELNALTGEFGTEFAQFDVLDASSLGDDAFGLHMEVDFSGLIGAFGEISEGAESPSGIAVDMYGFLRGDTMLMVMAMHTTDESTAVDALALAQLMAARAAS